MVLGKKVKTGSIETHLKPAYAQARTPSKDLSHMPTAANTVIKNVMVGET